ncbi:HEAT repeat domain-containing protein [Nocardia sp. NPDC006044]|uniref:HEAT repeat domain-containing protein n=1 Tax=Nocardia sp. NPDC006044 TaxID=3364306 RepID=UPI0036CEB4C7
MRIEDAIAALESAEEHVRQSAVETLIASGRRAIPAMVRELRETDSTARADACAQVLTGLGPLAYPPLLELLSGIRTAPESIEVNSRTEYRVCRLLGLPTINQAAYYAEHSWVGAEYAARYWVANHIGEHRLSEYGFVLAVLLGDDDERVHTRAAKAFVEIGTELVPMLHQIRRSSLPARHLALQVLAEIGWHSIAPEDLRLLHRFVTSELAREAPQVPASTKCLWWALPTDDREAVLEAFGLSDPVPATIAMGKAVAEQSGLRWAWECEQVYVSPVLNGWTLVFGDASSHYPRDEQRIRAYLEDDFTAALFELHSDDMKEVTRESVARPSLEERCIELSLRFGAAHYYKEVDAYDWGGWCIAEQGEIRRKAEWGDAMDDLSLDGDGHPSEQGLRVESISTWLGEHGFAPSEWDELLESVKRRFTENSDRSTYDAVIKDEWAKFEQRTGIPKAMTTTRIAERASVGPASLGPGTEVKGHGVLALTEYGRRTGGYRSALPLTPTAVVASIRPTRGRQ